LFHVILFFCIVLSFILGCGLLLVVDFAGYHLALFIVVVEDAFILLTAVIDEIEL
jgi:hypothetical protein